jgi:hypothetical protein
MVVGVNGFLESNLTFVGAAQIAEVSFYFLDLRK